MTDTLDLAAVEVTDAQLAALAGVTPRRIRQLAEAGAITRVGRNRFSLGAAFKGLIEELAGGERAGDLTAERIRKTRADADMAELELAKARQLVAPISEMEKQWETFCVILRTNMRLIPQRVAPAIIGLTDERQLKAKLMEEVDLALHAAADYAANPDHNQMDTDYEPDE